MKKVKKSYFSLRPEFLIWKKITNLKTPYRIGWGVGGGGGLSKNLVSPTWASQLSRSSSILISASVVSQLGRGILRNFTEWKVSNVFYLLGMH